MKWQRGDGREEIQVLTDVWAIEIEAVKRERDKLVALLVETKPYLWNGLGEPPHIWDLVQDALSGPRGKRAVAHPGEERP
ncbi:MAG: hypothetical protein E6J91_45705 [Deltaproteobacteria bacterium]|nr:MAG: hypothetical protein E6J91_45705 [Deltaproteobacteria bacterium]